MYRGMEKYFDVVGDIVNSHDVLIMNAFCMLWSGRNTIPWCANYRIGGKKP